MAVGPPVFKRIAPTAVVAGTPLAVWTPAAGKKFRLVGYSLGVTVAAAGVFFVEGAGNTALGIATPVLAINGVDSRDRLAEGALSAAADNALKVDVTANATVSGFVFGYEE